MAGSLDSTHPALGAVGRYRPLRLLGRGGMAEVWLAEVAGPQGITRQVALKLVLPSYSRNEQVVRMFLDEARVASRLTHPNIVQVHDFGEADGRYFIAMEYAQGTNLRGALKRLLARGERMPEVVAAAIGGQAASALAYAHALADAEGHPLGVVHRDISPENLLLTREGVVKVLDFGIAKAADRNEETQFGTLKGKPAYMSPEQATGKPLDGRSDVYSLGATLWEAVAGRKLYAADDMLAILNALANGTPEDLRDALPGCDPEFAAAVMWALTRQVAARPDAATFQDRLDALVHQRGVTNDQVAVAQFLAGKSRLPVPAAQTDLPAFEWPELSPSGFDANPSADTEPALAEPTPFGALDYPFPPPADAPTAISPRAGAAPPPAPLPPLPAPALPSRPLPGPKAIGEISQLELAVPMSPAPLPAPAEAPPPLAPAVRPRYPAWLPFAALLGGLALAAAGFAFLRSRSGPAEDPSPGTLTHAVLFQSEPPGALLTVDGNATGQRTPASVRVPRGAKHEVTLALDGHAPWSGAVEDPPGDFAPAIALVPLVSVRVETEPPGAAIDCDGRRVLEATPGSFTVTRGSHALKAQRDGFAPAAATVVVSPESPRWSARLEPIAFLKVVTARPGAEVLVDGAATGLTTPADRVPVTANIEHAVSARTATGEAAPKKLPRLAAGSQTVVKLVVVDRPDPKAAARRTLEKQRAGLASRRRALESEQSRLETALDAMVVHDAGRSIAQRKRLKAIAQELDRLAEKEDEVEQKLAALEQDAPPR